MLSIVLAVLGFSAALTTAAPLTSRQTASPFGLAIAGTRFDPNYLQTFTISYANTSAWLGQIKYQTYSEPLIVSGASGSSTGLSFSSIHSSPTGWQEMYIVPGETQPVGFSVPHGGAPAGVQTTGFEFDGNGFLEIDGANNFWACQSAEQAEINTYQIWWFGAGEPNGVSCKGPLGIKQESLQNVF